MRFTPKKIIYNERSRITILIGGIVFTAALAAGFAVPAFAADDYNSSRSNTSISVANIPIANKHVGDILLRYGVGGAEINKVTDALARGISKVDLKATLVAIGINEEGIQAVFTKLDELGAGFDSYEEKKSAGDGNAHGFPDRRADSPEKEFTSSQWGYIGLEGKALRDNFRENIKTMFKGDGTPVRRIAVAHGKGLRMLNRYRSAMARFDHILGRLESRIEKMKIENVAVLIEEAKNMQIENEAKMEELKAKYESLLLGENAGGIAEEARAIAAELKTDIENLHAKLRGIAGSGSTHGRPDR